jgi:hypothetical protein
MPAGGEHADQPRAAQDRGDERCHPLDDVLAVVQQTWYPGALGR